VINIFYEFDISRFSITEEEFERLVGEIDKTVDLLHNRIVNLYVASKEKIREYNLQYRKKDSPTDVLSFSYGDEEEAGDIVISPEVIYENAVRYGEDFLDELLKIIIHGILHIFGYDHEGDEEEARRMFEKQDEYFYKVKKRLEEE